MPAVTIYHSDGSTETIPATVGYKYRRELQQMWRLKITVERSQAQAVSLTRKQDEVELSGVKRGVLTDIDNGGSTWTLTVRSPEWYATQQAPTLGGDKREGDDNALLTTLINAVPQWSVGTVADLTGPMTFVFNHAFANEAMRKIEKNVPGELQWSGDGTVDYLDALGTDKSGSVTLSPSEGNLENEIQIQDKGRKFDATHLRVIGAHEGEAQRFAQLVPQADPQTYENEVRYTQPRWTEAADTDWERWENKDVVAQDTIQEEAEALAPELTETYVEATATVSGEDLSVGDYVRVVKDDADLDRTMRIHRITTRTKQDTTAAVVDEVQLSTRTTVRDGPSDMGRDIQRFNTGFQGSSVVVQGGGSRQPVDATNNAEIPFDYPDIEFEHEAVLQVRGLPYRAYSQGAADGGGVTQTSEAGGTNSDTTESGGFVSTTSGDGGAYLNTTSSGPNDNASVGSLDSNTSVTFLSGDQSFTNEFGVNFFSSVESVFAVAFLNNQNTGATVEVRWEDDSGTFYPDSNGVPLSNPEKQGTASIFIPETIGGFETQVQVSGSSGNAVGNLGVYYVAAEQHNHDVTIDIPDHNHAVTIPDHTHEFDWLHDHSFTLPDHTHDPEPGLLEFANTPTGCDVIINGSTVATDIGSGTFETEVDISGELDRDAWNDIEITSTALGHIQATVSIDGYKQIGTR